VTLLLPLLAFVLGWLLVVGGAIAFSSGNAATIERRLVEVAASSPRALDVDPDRESTFVQLMKRLGQASPKLSSETGKLRQRLVAAGYRQNEALIVFFGIRLTLAVAAFGVMATPLIIHPSLPAALVACLIGYVVPGMILARLAKRRQHLIRLGLPDVLDLLVVSVEAGLGLDQAIQRVGEELAFAHPDLSDELRLVNLQLRAGKGRGEALHNLADRTGVDDVRSLVAMLVQTDKFGTSVAQSLRVHSDVLRTKRRQRAEEAAAKTGVKMVFPLVFCIFPAVWVVTIGPAAVKFLQILFPLAESMKK
jgi:tight adherence protein C